MDLRDLWRGDLSFRRVKVLLDRLPDESCTWSEIRDDLTPEQMAEQQKAVGGKRKHGRWSRTDMLLALLADRLDASNFLQRVHDAQGDKPARARVLKQKPTPLPRPGVVDEKEIPPMSPEGVSFLEAMRKNRGGYTPKSGLKQVSARNPAEVKRLQVLKDSGGAG